MNDAGHLVVIEWDGMKPPTAFYHRVRSLTSGVRQDDSEDARKISPFARRSSRNETAVIMQEGAIYCMSKSLARSLALLAQQYGASNVEVATVEKMAQVEATKADIEALSKINKVLGRRGRPPAKRLRNISITCYEEVRTVDAYTDKDIINCPSCGSLDVEIGYFSEETGRIAWFLNIEESLFENWLFLRLYRERRVSFYEVEYLDDYSRDNFYAAPFDNPAKPNANIIGVSSMYSYVNGTTSRLKNSIKDLPSIQKRDILEMMANSNLNFLDKFYLHPEIIVQILDAIFIGQYMLDKEERLEGRLITLSSAMVRFPDIAQDYLLALNTNKVDFFDAAPVIPVAKMIEYFSHIQLTKMPAPLNKEAIATP